MFGMAGVGSVRADADAVLMLVCHLLTDAKVHSDLETCDLPKFECAVCLLRRRGPPSSVPLPRGGKGA